jgi:hypothetical protein
MKEFFLETFRGHRYEFTRVATSVLDVWYHIRMSEQSGLEYRMHFDKSGNWKITTKRTPASIHALERDFGEVISRNEQFN